MKLLVLARYQLIPFREQKRQGHGGRFLPALRVLVNCFVIVDEVGFKQDACSRDRIHGSDARNDHFSMLIMTMEE